MPDVRSHTHTRARQQFATARFNRNVRQPQSSNGDGSDTSITAGSEGESDTAGQFSHYDAVRAEDQRRYAAGERPGPDWKEEEAMKAWLEQRFPRGTNAGSPYYQFLITSSRCEGIYWLPGRGSEEVVGKLSAKEWKNWKREKAGLVMHAKWGPNPLYSDEEEAYHRIFQDLDRSDAYARPLVQPEYGVEQDLHMPHGEGNAGNPSGSEDHRNTNSRGLRQAHSSSKRTADDAELDPGRSLAGKRIKYARATAYSSAGAHSNPEKAGSSKKRTADDAEITAGGSLTAKRIKQSPGTKTSFKTENLSPPSQTSRGNGTIKELEHTPRPSLARPENEASGGSDHHVQSRLILLEGYDDQASVYVSQSSTAATVGQDDREDPAMSDVESTEEGENTNASGVSNQAPCQIEKSAALPQGNIPQTPEQQAIQVMVPAPHQETPSPVKKRKEGLKQVKEQSKKRRTTSESSFEQTPYTTKHLRSGVGKRKHKTPRLVHLRSKGRKDVQVAGCFRY